MGNKIGTIGKRFTSETIKIAENNVKNFYINLEKYNIQ